MGWKGERKKEDISLPLPIYSTYCIFKQREERKALFLLAVSWKDKKKHIVPWVHTRPNKMANAVTQYTE